MSEIKRIMLFKYNILLALTISAFILSCASTIELSATDRQKIEAVYINTNVEKVLYSAPAARIIETFSEQNNIFIDKIVVEELASALRQSGILPIIGAPSRNSATLNILYIKYGFTTDPFANPFSHKLKAWVSISCTIVDISEKVIWSARSHSLYPATEASTLDEMKANPKLIENAWRAAAKEAIADLIRWNL